MAPADGFRCRLKIRCAGHADETGFFHWEITRYKQIKQCVYIYIYIYILYIYIYLLFLYCGVYIYIYIYGGVYIFYTCICIYIHIYICIYKMISPLILCGYYRSTCRHYVAPFFAVFRGLLTLLNRKFQTASQRIWRTSHENNPPTIQNARNGEFLSFFVTGFV